LPVPSAEQYLPMVMPGFAQSIGFTVDVYIHGHRQRSAPQIDEIWSTPQKCRRRSTDAT